MPKHHPRPCRAHHGSAWPFSETGPSTKFAAWKCEELEELAQMLNDRNSARE